MNPEQGIYGLSHMAVEFEKLLGHLCGQLCQYLTARQRIMELYPYLVYIPGVLGVENLYSSYCQYVCLYICLSVCSCLCVCLFICLSICSYVLSVHVSVYRSVCLHLSGHQRIIELYPHLAYIQGVLGVENLFSLYLKSFCSF